MENRISAAYLGPFPEIQRIKRTDLIYAFLKQVLVY